MYHVLTNMASVESSCWSMIVYYFLPLFLTLHKYYFSDSVFFFFCLFVCFTPHMGFSCSWKVFLALPSLMSLKKDSHKRRHKLVRWCASNISMLMLFFVFVRAMHGLTFTAGCHSDLSLFPCLSVTLQHPFYACDSQARCLAYRGKFSVIVL